jgi:large subunit ribosomal protein L39
LFNKEKKRQNENVGRIEKIEVQYTGTPEDATLIMNKGISTPFNCAQRNNFITLLVFLSFGFL